MSAQNDHSLQTIETGFDATTVDATKVTVRNLRITDLRATLAKVAKDHPDWQQLNIYADQIEGALPSGYTLNLGGRSSVTIVARSLDLSNGSLGFVKGSTLASVRLRIQHYQASDRPFFVGSRGHSLIPALAKGPFDLDYKVTLAGNPKALPFVSAGSVPPEWKIGSDFYWQLLYTFQAAFAQDDDAAKSMFRWIVDNAFGLAWQGDSRHEMQDLAAQAAGMLQRLSRPTGVFYVPLLTDYATTVESYADQASTYERTFDAFMGQATDYTVAAASARKLVGDALLQPAISYDGQIIRQNEQKLIQARVKLEDNFQQFEQQVVPLNAAEGDFKRALDQWRQEAKVKAYVQLGTFVGKLGASVAAGNPGDLISVPSEVMDLADAFDKADTDVTPIYDLAQQIKTACEQFNRAGAYGQNSKKLYDYSKGGTPPEDTTAAQFSAPTVDGTQWQIAIEKWDANFKGLAGMDGLDQNAVAKYQAEGRILFIWGQAITASQTTIANIEEHLAQLHLQQSMHEKQKALVGKYADSLETTRKGYYQLALLVRQRYMAAKRSVLTALGDSNDAYRYWALRSPFETASLIGRVARSTISSLPEIKTAIGHAADNALKHFANQSRPENAWFYLQRELSDDDRTALEAGRKVHVVIARTGDELDLKVWDRARVEDLAVAFASAGGDAGGFTVVVQDSGVYQDRFGKTPWSFIAEKVSPFQVTAGLIAQADLKPNGIETKGTVDLTASQGHLYRPGLCTTWAVQLTGTNTNLKGISHLQLTFKGTAIGVGS